MGASARQRRGRARKALVTTVVVSTVLIWALLPGHEDDPERGLYSNVSIPNPDPTLRLVAIIASVALLCPALKVIIAAASR